MADSRLAVSTALFDGYDFATAFDEIAAAGPGFVEPAFIVGYTDFTEATLSEKSAQALSVMSKQSGLSIGAVSAHMDLGRPDGSTADFLKRRIAFAATCGCSVLITNAGFARDLDTICRQIEAALPLCENLGVMLALENPGHGAGAAIFDLVSGRELIARFQHPLVKLNYDAGNVFSYSYGQLQPGDDVAACGADGIGYLHLKDLLAQGGDWNFCPLGQGLVDHRDLISRLPAGLPMSVELPLRLSRPGRGDPVRRAEPLPLAVLREALQYSLGSLGQGA